MAQRPKTNLNVLVRPTWREYQDRLKKTDKKERFVKKSFKIFIILLTFIAVSYGVVALIKWGWESFLHTPSVDSVPADDADIMDKKRVRVLMGDAILNNLDNKRFEFVANKAVFHIETSIDPTLQKFLQKKAQASIARNIGIVCMAPYTGRILSMVGFDKTDTSINPCVDSRFPAASIFKIVTAAAAIEQCGFNLKTKLSFNGRKHTLYRSQLKEKKNKYTNEVTFMNSFAQSINPVFGKIGSHHLGKDHLKTYALIFGFNCDINFEVRLNPSVFSISDDPYQWAEIASGFNHKSNITPLHGALIASVISDQGKLVEPTIIKKVMDEAGDVVYQSEPVVIRQIIDPDTAKTIRRLMVETINTGTFRRTFKGYKKNETLSKLDIGGKSGSIASPSNHVRYDWFVGYAKEKEGNKKMALAVLVTHQKYIGKRAGDFARMAMEKYFGDYFALE